MISGNTEEEQSSMISVDNIQYNSNDPISRTHNGKEITSKFRFNNNNMKIEPVIKETLSIQDEPQSKVAPINANDFLNNLRNVCNRKRNIGESQQLFYRWYSYCLNLLQKLMEAINIPKNNAKEYLPMQAMGYPPTYHQTPLQ